MAKPVRLVFTELPAFALERHRNSPIATAYPGMSNLVRPHSALDGNTPDALYYRHLPALKQAAPTAGGATALHALAVRFGGRRTALRITLHPQNPT